MSFAKAASNIIALFVFVRASYYLHHNIYIEEILPDANIHTVVIQA